MCIYLKTFKRKRLEVWDQTAYKVKRMLLVKNAYKNEKLKENFRQILKMFNLFTF